MVKDSFERATLIAEMRLCLINLILIANGFEKNTSSILDNRYKYYKELMNTKQ
jgi:hypothetical protein